MECEYCNHVLKTSYSLKQHQKTTKYCLAKQNKSISGLHSCGFCGTGFTLKSTLYSHLRICKANTSVVQKNLQLLEEISNELAYVKQKLIEKDMIIAAKDKIENEQKENIKELHIDYKKKILEQKTIIKKMQADYKKQTKDFHDRMQSMAEKAIDKPSTVNKNTTTQIINNLLPITPEHLEDQVQFLTKEHVKNGALGYAKYALEYPLKDRLVCTDVSRRKGKYKDSDGNLVSDPEMSSITKKLFSAIKDRNAVLIDEHALDLKAKLDEFNLSEENEMNETNSIEFSSTTDKLVDYITAAYSQKREAREMSEGLKPEMFYEFVKELASGSYFTKS
jgi:hypothetical protein